MYTRPTRQCTSLGQIQITLMTAETTGKAGTIWTVGALGIQEREEVTSLE